MNPWLLVYEGFDPQREALREALCAVGNGYMVSRAAAPEASADGVHYPGTYAAGCYNRLQTEIAGETVENESMVNMPNWLVLRFSIDGEPWISVDDVEVLEYHQELDLGHGLLTRRIRCRDHRRRTLRIVERRFVHMELEHVAALQTTLVAEDWEGSVRVRSALDGGVENSGVARYRDLASAHLEMVGAEDVAADTLLLRARTNQSQILIAEAARTRVVHEGLHIEPQRRVIREPKLIAHEFTIDVGIGEEVTVEKTVALYTSRDTAVSEPGYDALAELTSAPAFAPLLGRHMQAWSHLWDRFRFELHVNDDVLQVVRLHLFHLLQTVSPNSIDLDVGVPPRGLHGEAYRGLIMWDELFVFPIITPRLPALTRSQLSYRYRRLPAARRAAREAGLRGAMFPWQSGSNGEEMAQRLHLNPESGRWVPDVTYLQRHIGLGVAYNVAQYHEATADLDFLSEEGAQLVLEIARFFGSLATYDHGRDRYVIRGVVGPDEFHVAYPDAKEPGLDNNAYTNVLASWVLRWAYHLPDLLPEQRRAELLETLSLHRDELEHWDEVSRKLLVPFHDGGIISQFEGYGDLEELDWEGYRRRYGDLHRLDRILEAEGDSPDRYKASKQADVLMLPYLFSPEQLCHVFRHMDYELKPDQIQRTMEYYLHRTTHGSTLSSVVHAWVLARFHRDQAYEYFVHALESDVADVQGGTTAEGIHLGAMAGSVDLLQRCFTGIEMRGSTLCLDPHWPEELGPLEFDMVYRGHPLTLHVAGDHIRVESRPGVRPPINVGCRGEPARLRPGEAVDFPLP